MQTKLDRIAEKARTDSTLRFTALAHLLTPDFLMETWKQMNRRGASGIDKETTAEFAANLEGRCHDLVVRLKERRYKPPPVKRVEIPKGEGKTRPLGIPTVEDRLLQRAVARILGAVYEEDFLPCSYGFRRGRNPHQAIAELRNQAMFGGARYVFETDIRGFFNHLSHEWLMRMLRLRIGDPEILRLVGKWLRAGALIDGIVVRSEQEGSPQGGPISPLLANIYLHYALDLWFEKRFHRKCRGKASLIRFADDFVATFEHQEDTRCFEVDVYERMAKFGLELAAEKTKLLPFGRWAPADPERPQSLEFLGFKFTGGKDAKGRYAVIRTPSTKSCRKFLDGVREWLRRNMHANKMEQSRHLSAMLRGFYQYFGLYNCTKKLGLIRYYVTRLWRKSLRRRSQRSKLTWKSLKEKLWFKLPIPRVVHRNV